MNLDGVCWADAPTAHERWERGEDTSALMCGQTSQTDVGLCMRCYDDITGKVHLRDA